jgi:hypothetical protein
MFVLPYDRRFVERRLTGINEGRLSEGVPGLPRKMGRGIWEGECVFSGTRRTVRRGVEGRDSVSPSAPTTTQLSAVRRRFAIRGRSGVIDSIDWTP